MSMAVVPHEGPGVLSLGEQEQARILQALGLDIRNPLTQALLLVAQRYDLDPLLKQVQIIKSNVYITHAGLLHIAHASGKLDGIEVIEESDDKDAFRAKVAVYRKDMRMPFTYTGEFRKSRVRSDGASGREMALKNAERSALRRAFDITAPTMDDSGADMDDVMPGTDIDIPEGIKPPALVEAIAVPEPEPVPKEPAVAADATTATSTTASAPAPVADTGPSTPSAEAASAKPAATRKPRTKRAEPIDPETGEIPADEARVVTESPKVMQEHMQARAREIAAAKAEPVAETPQKKVIRKTTPAKPKEKQYPEEVIKRAQALHMTANEQQIEETMLRDVVLVVTDKRTSSTRELDANECELVRSLLVAIGQDLIDYEYSEEGELVIDMGLAPDDAEYEADVVLSEPVEAEVVRDWKQECQVRNIKDGMFLRKARAIAEEKGIPIPANLKDVTGPDLERALWEWIKDFPPHTAG